MEVILDTNALSALADGDEALRGRLIQVYAPSIPAVVLGEFLYGLRDSRDRARYETWLESSLPLFDALPIQESTARHYADIRRELRMAGRPIPENDIWIAALAREHGMPVLSRDRHFAFVPQLRVESW
jgi:tRNA(fMet)-specific endonuclease VapC